MLTNNNLLKPDMNRNLLNFRFGLDFSKLNKTIVDETC